MSSDRDSVLERSLLVVCISCRVFHNLFLNSDYSTLASKLYCMYAVCEHVYEDSRCLTQLDSSQYCALLCG